MWFNYRFSGPRLACPALRAAVRMAIQVRERHRDAGDPFGSPDAESDWPTLRLFFAIGAITSTWPADDCFNALLDKREVDGRWSWEVS
jgi:hypothetical protein